MKLASCAESIITAKHLRSDALKLEMLMGRYQLKIKQNLIFSLLDSAGPCSPQPASVVALLSLMKDGLYTVEHYAAYLSEN